MGGLGGGVFAGGGGDLLVMRGGREISGNRGRRESGRERADGIREGRGGDFVLELPLDRAAGADAVEVSLLDAAGNAGTRRLRF